MFKQNLKCEVNHIKQIVPKSIKKIWIIMMAGRNEYIVIFILLGLISILLDIIEPYFAKILIDRLQTFKFPIELIKLGIIWLIIYFIKNIINIISSKINLKFKINVIYSLRIKLFEKIIKLPISYFKEHSVGYIMSRQIDDIDDLDGMLLNNIVSGVLSLIEFIVIFIIMMNINTILAIISLVIMFGNVVLNFIFPLKKLYKVHSDARANVSKNLQDCLSGINLVKASDAYNFETNRFGTILKSYYSARKNRDFIDIIRKGLVRFLEGVSIPLIVVIGGLFVYRGIFTTGSILAYIIYFQKLTDVFVNATNFIPLLKIAEASADRICEILDLGIDVNIDSEKVNDISLQKACSIEFKNVYFSYDNNKNTLNNISFKINPGEKVAFVGKSGSGKTSIVNLLLGYFTPSNGQILINDIDIKKYNLSNVLNAIGVVSQDLFLFNRTVLENIIYNTDKNKISEEKLKAVLDRTLVSEIIKKMPNGMNTLIGDKGNTISGGEKQRLCIAREILKEPMILVLDEATSALDSISEELVQTAINNVSNEKTVIMIAHKLSSIKNSDKIYVIDNGRIVEKGTHDELLKKEGEYYSLYKKQINLEGDEDE